MDHSGTVVGIDEAPASTTEQLAQDADWLLEQGDYAGAAALLNAAIMDMGERADLLWPLAKAEFGLREYDRALAVLDRTGAVESSPATLINRRIMILTSAGMVSGRRRPRLKRCIGAAR